MHVNMNLDSNFNEDSSRGPPLWIRNRRFQPNRRLLLPIPANHVKIMGLLTTLLFACALISSAQANQTALYLDLFRNYHNSVRPMCEFDVPVNVSIGLAVRQIIELDEPKQILTLNAWVRLNWVDCQLTWTPSSYGGLTSLNVPFTKIWIPDITLYDNANGEMAGFKDFRPTVYSNGLVVYNFPTVISTLCKVDVTYFPFDTQSCPLKFGSWTYHGFHVDVSNRSSAGDVTSFMQNSEWETPVVPVTRNVVYYGCCIEPYPDVTFKVTVKRKPLFYVLNLLFPCILITAVALLGFMLPPDAGEKVSLEITVLLSLAVFLLVVSETLPPTSENFPYIGIYFACAMLLVSFSTVLTVVVLNIHFKGYHGRHVPWFIRRYLLGTMGRLLCVRQNESLVHPHCEDDTFSDDTHGKQVSLQDVFPNKAHVISNGISNGGFRMEDKLDIPPEEETQLTEFPADHMKPMLKVLREQLHVLKSIDHRHDVKEKIEHLHTEWQKVAIVLDRIFLVIFALVSVVITLAILLQCI